MSTLSSRQETERPRIVITTTDLPPTWGGIQRVVHELAIRLTERWTVAVVAPDHPAAQAYDVGVPFSVLRTRTEWAGSRARCLADMTRLTAKLPADVLFAAHVNTLPVWLVRPRTPKVVLFHGQELWAPMSRTIARILATRAQQVMAISRFTATEAERLGIPTDRISVTPVAASPPEDACHGDSTLRRLGLVSDRGRHRFFLTVSRLDEPHKGHDVFLRALPHILSRYTDLRYVIAGDGPLAPGIRALADSLGVGHAVVMPGSISERAKGELMRACTAYVMVSRELRRPALFEGFGITYLEAAFAGRPSLAGDSGGVRDAIVDGTTGLLVDPSSVQAVTRAALHLLDEPGYADRLGRAARERAERGYTWDIAIGRMERVLTEAMACR